jgi:hypothetical protein
MKYDIYLNRRKMKKDGQRVYSIRACAGQFKSKVRWTNQCVLISGAEFVVQTAGRQDTLNRMSAATTDGVAAKTVHAFIRGKVVYRGRSALMRARKCGFLNPSNENLEVSYNPIFNETFVDSNGSPIFNAPVVLCSPTSVIAVSGLGAIETVRQ